EDEIVHRRACVLVHGAALRWGIQSKRMRGAKGARRNGIWRGARSAAPESSLACTMKYPRIQQSMMMPSRRARASVRWIVTFFLVLGISYQARAAIFSVTTANDSGVGSLRQALLDANSASDLDTIVFNIAGPGPHTISPGSTLPTILYPVVIDGFSQ